METYFATERTYGSFARTFTLPGGTDPEHTTAELRDGVLPKMPEVQPKKIPVGAGEKPQAKAQALREANAANRAPSSDRGGGRACL